MPIRVRGVGGRILADIMGNQYYNGYRDENARSTDGQTNSGQGYLRDLNNAKRFDPGVNPVRQRFQGYVNFNFNPAIDITSLHSKDTKNTLSSLVRTASVPSAELQTDVKNQYNRKRVTITHTEFKPIEIPAYDTVDSAWVIVLMKAYAHLFTNPIGKFDVSGDRPAPKKIKADVVPAAIAGGGSEAVPLGEFESDLMGMNLRDAATRNFITRMEIVKYHGQKAIRYVVFNPIITSFEIEGIDHGDSSPAMINMSIQYENFSIDPKVNDWLTEAELERFSGFNLGEWELLRNGNAQSAQLTGFTGSDPNGSVLNNPAMGVKNLDFLTGGSDGGDVRTPQSDQFWQQFSGSSGDENVQ